MAESLLIVYIFIIAAIAGAELIARVPVILHTPLMSGANFIHGIVAVGSIIALSQAENVLEICIGSIGLAFAIGNAVGGYFVTVRMLKMFKSSKEH